MPQRISDEPLPGWLSRRPGMLEQTRNQMVGQIDGLRMLGRDVKTVVDRPISCGCFVNRADDRHFDSGVLLNPDQDTVGEQRIAVLYENLMHVGTMTSAYLTDTELPRVAVGRAESMWWVVSTLEPGWYDNEGRSVDYEFNPTTLGERARIMPTRVANGTRLLGDILEWDGGSYGRVFTGRDVETDRSGPALNRWVLDSFIAPVPQHRPSLPPAVPVEFVDTTVTLTIEQQMTRLNERFAALTSATVSKAKDEDWCGDYDEASRAMGLAEDDYDRTANTEPTSFEVSITLRYELGPSDLDRVIGNQFGGSHDIQMSVDVESPIRVTVTQEDNEEFDRDTHDWDDILDSAGYSDYEDIDITSWRTV